MPRDKIIKRAFEVADDGMQSIIGYFHYVAVTQKLAQEKDIIEKLPSSELRGQRLWLIRITNDWVRNYDPLELCEAMNNFFVFQHTRISLVSLISVFEGALMNFTDRLAEIHGTARHRSYKKRLEWAFDMAKGSKMGGKKTRDTIRDVCLVTDHARRIRNLWMHNNGLFDEHYARDVIAVDGGQPIIDPAYYQYLRNKKPHPVVVHPDAFSKIFSISHIELLHHLHDAIQRTHFGQKVGYGYREEKKKIEWARLLQAT